MSRKKTGQNLVQVSTYAPLVDKLKLEAIAARQGKTLYALVRDVLQEYIAKEEELKTKKEDQGENLL